MFSLRSQAMIFCLAESSIWQKLASRVSLSASVPFVMIGKVVSPAASCTLAGVLNGPSNFRMKAFPDDGRLPATPGSPKVSGCLCNSISYSYASRSYPAASRSGRTISQCSSNTRVLEILLRCPLMRSSASLEVRWNSYCHRLTVASENSSSSTTLQAMLSSSVRRPIFVHKSLVKCRGSGLFSRNQKWEMFVARAARGRMFE